MCDSVRGGSGGDSGEWRDVRREMREWREGLRRKYAAANMPECYRGYEALLEEDPTPTTHVPTGLYTHHVHAYHVHVSIYLRVCYDT